MSGRGTTPRAAGEEGGQHSLSGLRLPALKGYIWGHCVTWRVYYWIYPRDSEPCILGDILLFIVA